MPKTFFDGEGNEVKLPTPEEYQTLESQKNIFEEKVKEMEKSLRGLKDKDYNFSALLKSKEKLGGKTSALVDEINRQKEQMEQVQKSLRQSWRSQTLMSLDPQGQIDEEAKKQVFKKYGQLIKGKSKNEQEVKDAFQDAFTLITAKMNLSNTEKKEAEKNNLTPFTNMAYVGNGVSPKKNKTSELRPEVKQIGYMLGLPAKALE